MCGRYNLVDSPEVQALMAAVGMPLYPHQQLRFSPDIAPGARISIIRHFEGDPVVSDATWWLMLDPATGKPNYKYSSFNSRSDKLHTPRAIAYHPYRSSRCIIPASAFIEGLGDGRTYHKIELQGQAIAFGGIYKQYVNQETGEVIRGASIITLPPLAEWSEIHTKASPLMLPLDQGVLQQWMDQELTDVSQLEWLLQPEIRVTQIVTQIGKVSKWDAIGESKKIHAIL